MEQILLFMDILTIGKTLPDTTHALFRTGTPARGTGRPENPSLDLREFVFWKSREL
jgi:hypothetical protein